MLQLTGLQRVGHKLTTEQQQDAFYVSTWYIVGVLSREFLANYRHAF